MKKYLIGFSSVVLVIIVLAIAGQFGRDLSKRAIPSKEVIEIKNIADQYAVASKKVTSALSKFNKDDQEIKRSVEQLRSLKELLLKSKNAFEHHEKIRARGYSYLINNKNAFSKDFYDDMLFSVGHEYISIYNQAFNEFSSEYMELIDYMIANFDKIASSTFPEITYYNKGWKKCEILRQKCNEAYLNKMDILRQRYGDAEVNQITKELKE